MTDAEHAAVMRQWMCSWPRNTTMQPPEFRAAIERAIELLEGATAIPKMRSTAMAEREQRFRTGTDVIMAEPVEAAPADTPLTAPQAFIPKAER